ncbi:MULTISPECIES: TetR/AcrR family transcriptional regulator [unclassified Nocardia]|uniref:TetR/AcrR family transcriptional regulator n=1 Tax=unclassified Nocardia TaxID=2637762 RepID=UPI0035DE3B6D
MAATRNYGGVSAADRRAIRRTALFEAALDLVTEEGASAVTKKAVCVRAGLTDRYFYEHFADRDALVESLAHELTEQGLAAGLAAIVAAEPQIPAQVHAAIEAAATFIDEDPRRGALLMCAPTIDAIQRARKDAISTVANTLSALIPELTGDDPADRTDTDMVCFTLIAGLVELGVAWLRGEFAVSRQHFIDLATAILLSGMRIPSQLPASPT